MNVENEGVIGLDNVFYDVHDVLRRNVLAGKTLTPISFLDASKQLDESKIAMQFMYADYSVPENRVVAEYIFVKNGEIWGVAGTYAAKTLTEKSDLGDSKFLVLDTTI